MKIETPEFMLEVFLQPGEYHWADTDTRIRTILGSCIAMCFWHPRLKTGGMIHYMLPMRLDKSKADGKLDAKYGDEAIELILQEMKKINTAPREYHLKVFGGANMFKKTVSSSSIQVGERNIELAHQLIKKIGFDVKTENVGGETHRSIMFDMWSGDVWLKKPKGE